MQAKPTTLADALDEIRKATADVKQQVHEAMAPARKEIRELGDKIREEMGLGPRTKPRKRP